MYLVPEVDHCRTAADVMAAARRVGTFRHEIQRRPVLLARAEAKRQREAEQALALAEQEALAAEIAAEEARQANAEREKREAAITPSRLTVRHLVVIAADILGVSYAELCSDRRMKPLPDHRHCIAWCARDLTPRSLPAIGKVMRRDHTTILHGIRRVDADIKVGGDLGKAAIRLRSEIERRLALEQEAG